MSLRDETFVFLADDKETNERRVFEAFVEIHPNFADQPIMSWDKGANPPDILCHAFSGGRIGVELTEWVNTDQIASAKAEQDLHFPYLGIVRSEGVPPPENIESVTICARRKAPLTVSEQQRFRAELYGCIESAAAKLAPSNGRQSVFVHDLSGYPWLSKYVAWMELWPRPAVSRRTAARWVRFPARGGFYTPQPMVAALSENIQKKTERYSTLSREQALDELHLIVYYGSAILYNSPYAAPGFGIRDVAEVVGQALATNPGHFRKIFLFSPIEKKEKVFQLWPFTQAPQALPPASVPQPGPHTLCGE